MHALPLPIATRETPAAMEGVLLWNDAVGGESVGWVPFHCALDRASLVQFSSSRRRSIREILDLQMYTLRKRVSQLEFRLEPLRTDTRAVSLQAESRKARKKWERALSRYTASFSSRVNVSESDQACLIAREDGRIISVSNAMCGLAELHRGSLLNSQVRAIVPQFATKTHCKLWKEEFSGVHTPAMGAPRRLTLRVGPQREIPVIIVMSRVMNNESLFVKLDFYADDASAPSFTVDRLTIAAAFIDTSGNVLHANQLFWEALRFPRPLAARDISLFSLLSEGDAAIYFSALAKYRGHNKLSPVFGSCRRVSAIAHDSSVVRCDMVLGSMEGDSNVLVVMCSSFRDTGEAVRAGSSRSDEDLTDSSGSPTWSHRTTSDPRDFAEGLRGFRKSNRRRSMTPELMSASPITCPFFPGNSPCSSQSSPDMPISAWTGDSDVEMVPPQYQALFMSVRDGLERLLLQEILRLAKLQDCNESDDRSHRLPEQPIEVIVERRLCSPSTNCDIYSATVRGWRCAMKELDLTNALPEEVDRFNLEIRVSERLPTHPNCVRYLFHERSDRYIRIFTSMYEYTLYDRILHMKSKGYRFSKRRVVRCAQDIIEGMMFLHENGVLHRDLKSENIFVVLDERGAIRSLVVGNFRASNKYCTSSSIVGTPGYVAPEVMEGTSYTFPVDVWSFGMVLYELLTLERPFEGMSILQMSTALSEGAPKLVCNPSLAAFVPVYEACTRFDPESRPSFQQVREMLSAI